MVYENARATQQKTFDIWKINVCKMKGLIVHPVVWEHLCGILEVLEIPKFPMEFPGGIISYANPFYEGLSLKIFIQDPWVNGGADFIQHEVFQALPEEKRS